jgi:hypothetical protein
MTDAQGLPVRAERAPPPQQGKEAASEGAWRAALLATRAFGLGGGDLDIDIADPDRPAVVTRVLAACLEGFADTRTAENAVWEWTVPERLQGLIAIAIADGSAQTPWETRCCRCAERVEMEMTPTDFVALPRNDQVACRAPDGRAITARLPRGSDQRAWRAEAADAPAMAATLVERIDGNAPGPNWRMPQDWLDPLADALAEGDPLTALQLYATCPACGHLNIIDFDLEAWVLGIFKATQAQLIDDVHQLAGFYHWSEAEICELPPWRRRLYLARIQWEWEAEG